VETAQEQHGAHEMEETEEVLSFVLPASGKPAPSLEPGEEALHHPTPLVSTQLAAVLSSVAFYSADALGGDEVNAALLCESSAQRAAIPGSVGNQSRW
jgi:hypothetical protein